MSKLIGFAMMATPFSAEGEIDEAALRLYIRRMIEAGLGVILGSGGNGEGHTLTLSELDRIYRIGVEECGGKASVHANLPEQHTARATIEHGKIAAAAGVDVVHFYPLAGWHGMRPNDAELLSFFGEVFSEIEHPSAIALGSAPLYVPRSEVVANLCDKHSQIVAIRVGNLPDTYLIDLVDRKKRNIAFFVSLEGSLNAFAIGARALCCSEANILPKTLKRYLDLCEACEFAEMANAYMQMRRLTAYVAPWANADVRWIKMALTLLKLPGGGGAWRRPYQSPAAAELARFSTGLLRLRIAEIEECARAAGLSYNAL